MQPVLMAVLSPFTGRLSDKVGSRVAGHHAAWSSWPAAWCNSPSCRAPRAVCSSRSATIGVGMAVFSAPNISAVMGSVDRSQLNLASGFLATMRFTGQGLSIALLGPSPPTSWGPRGRG